MNKLLSVFVLLGFTFVKAQEEPEAMPDCLYCKRMDENSGFLVSYSFCQAEKTCLKDAWNYINRDCTTDWVKGSKIKLQDCNPNTINCPDEFVSTAEKYGTYENATWTLPEGAMCDIKVDARNSKVARVIFDETSYLGIEGKYKIGEVITIENERKTIKIYNAAPSGALTFLISFSGAAHLATAVASALLVAASL